MGNDEDVTKLRRKRRRINKVAVDDVANALEPNVNDVQPPEVRSREHSYDFLHLVSLVTEAEIPVIFPGNERPRNTESMVAAGGSFVVFKEHRTMNDAVLRPQEIWSLSDDIVLKRTRAHGVHAQSKAKTDSLRYASIISELQLFVHKEVRENWNIIDFHGITWDIETTDEGISSLWPVIALEAAQGTFEAFILDTLDDRAELLKIEYCHGIAKALKFLHDHGVAHCDIKAENILICDDTNVNNHAGGTVAKISDFGSAILGVSDDMVFSNGIAGTRPWNAPEWRSVIHGCDVYCTDVYSFAMLLWRALSPSSCHLVGLKNGPESYARALEALESLKLNDGTATVAYTDLLALQLQDVCHSSSEIVKNSLILNPKLRWDVKRIELILSEAAASIALLEDDNSNSEQKQNPIVEPSETSLGEDQQEDEEEELDAKIRKLPIEPFDTDVSMTEYSILAAAANWLYEV